MDIERLKKINRMTKDLQKAGFASNSREAHSQAESFFKENAPREEREDKKQEAAAPRSKEAEYLLEQKVRLLVDMHSKKVTGEVQAMREQIHGIIGQMASLRQELASLKKHAVQPAPLPEKKEPAKKEKNPRQGDFTSKDVSIEKMFYFGRK